MCQPRFGLRCLFAALVRRGELSRVENVMRTSTSEPVPSPRGAVEHPGAPMPYAGYATILGAFVGSVGATALLERKLRRARRPTSGLDYALLCAASFKAARALSRERVGSVLRQPFVNVEDDGGQPVAERPAGDGLKRAVGELVTCTRCAGTWTAAGLLASQVLAPRFGRLVTWSLAAGAANDFMQAGFAALVAREHPVRPE
jgi:hypothetical protein